MQINNLTFAEYMLLCTVAFLLVGIKWYILDRMFCTRLYRFIYRWTHRSPLLAEIERGFIYNQSAKVRWWWAFTISSIESLWIIFSGSQNPFVEMIAWVWEVPVLMVGIMIGPWAYKLWERKEKVFANIDKIEKGEIKVGEHIRSQAKVASVKVEKAFDTASEKIRETFSSVKPKEAPKPAPTQPSAPEMSGNEAEEALKRFTGRNK